MNHVGNCRKLFNIFFGANFSAHSFGKHDSREVWKYNMHNSYALFIAHSTVLSVYMRKIDATMSIRWT